MWPGNLRQTRRHDLAGPKYVKDLLAGNKQVVGNNPAMTPPPNRLCTHHGTAPDTAELTQPGQARLEAGAHRVIRVVVKALIFPEAIDAGRNIMRAWPKAAELGHMLVDDLKFQQ